MIYADKPKMSTEDYNKIIRVLDAANKGKQISQHYKGDKKFFKRKASDMTFNSFRKDVYKVTDFKENVPQLSNKEYTFISNALKWLQYHTLTSSISGASNIDISSMLEKIENRNINEEKGKYTKLIKIIRGMKSGKNYEYTDDFSTWWPLTLNMNISPLVELIKNNKVREIK